MIKLFYPANHFYKECLTGLETVLSGRWWGQAGQVQEFERLFAEEFAYPYCLALNSGSAALELAYDLIGISEGDEVITPVLTCTATNIPLARRKAKIVFADINKEDLVISAEDIKRKITDKTKAVVVVTLGGLPIAKEIFDLCKSKNIPVVVDAAQSLGVIEPYGDYICYSFQAIKHFTTGDGGMLVLRNQADYDRAKKLRWFGIDREKKIEAGWQPYRNREMTIEIEEPGYKFHMNDIAATIGIVGLKHSDELLKIREHVGQRYREELKNCAHVGGGSFWLYGVLINHRDERAEELLTAGIDVNMVHLRNDKYKLFGGRAEDLPNMQYVEDRYLYLPINSHLTDDDVDTVVKEFNRIVTN